MEIEFRIIDGGEPIRIARVRCENAQVLDDGPGLPPAPLAALNLEDQAFVAAFLRSHGNIREMERLFGVSYPTVKKRLNSIVSTIDRQFQAPARDGRGEVLRRLREGLIKPDQALVELDRLAGDSGPPQEKR